MYFYIVDCSKCMIVVFKWPSFTFFSLLNPLRTRFHPLKLQHKTKSFSGLLFWLVGLLRVTLPCWTQSEMCCKEQITKEVPQWPSTHLDSPDPLQFSLLADPPLKWRGAVPVSHSAPHAERFNLHFLKSFSDRQKLSRIIKELWAKGEYRLEVQHQRLFEGET